MGGLSFQQAVNIFKKGLQNNYIAPFDSAQVAFDSAQVAFDRAGVTLLINKPKQ